MAKKVYDKPKMVPVPSHSIIPERDANKSPILECSHLGIDFGGLRAVDDFNIAIGRTEIAGLIGPNGAGKTTVFNLLTKVYQPTRGTILLDGMDTAGKNSAQINRMGIARTFQNIRLFSDMTVEDNVKVGLHNANRYSMASGILRLPNYWIQEKAAHERALARTGPSFLSSSRFLPMPSRSAKAVRAARFSRCRTWSAASLPT